MNRQKDCLIYVIYVSDQRIPNYIMLTKKSRFLNYQTLHLQSYIYIKMLKALVVSAIVSLCLSTLQVYSPQCAVKRIPKPIQYTLSNFGDIPFGEVFMGQIRLPKNQQLCDIKDETYIHNTDTKTRVILLVKRGACKFTEKVINAQNLGADLIIIYDHENSNSSTPKVIMKNDGHGHLAKIPSMFISDTEGQKLKKIGKDCPDLPIVKVGFEIQQKQVSQVILWLDANNRESYILAREFYKNGYFKALEGKIKMDVRFRIDTQCKEQLFCKKADCVGTLKEKYCRNVQKADDGDSDLNGVAVIEQQLREYFLWEQLSEKNKIEWWNYMTQFDHEDCIEKKDVRDCSFTVMRNIKISETIITKVDAQVKSAISDANDEKPTILKESAVEATELGIYFYPQATINSRNFYGLFKASEVFEMICDSLIKPPKECITFIKNNNQIDTNDQTGGLWKNILIALLVMTAGFFIALFVYTRIIRREVDQQLSLQVNKMVENYVNLADKKKGNNTGNSYSKFDS